MKKIILIFIFKVIIITVSAQMTFVHPGADNNQAELDFVKAKIKAGAQPWSNALNQMLPLAITYTLTTSPQDGNENAQKTDAKQAYANALAWYYTGTEQYAKNAIAVLNCWGKTFNGYAVPAVGQGNQSQLDAAWIGALLGPAAEIMRGYTGWNPTDMATVQNMFKTKFYPALNQMSPWNGNVDLTQIDAMMNIAVFCEDETEFNLGLSRFATRVPSYFYLNSEGTNGQYVPPITGDGGNIQTFWSSPTLWVEGLTQETCRDNDHHAQFAMSSILHAAEVAWHQGVDVYTSNQERFIATLELMAHQIVSGNMQGTCADNTTLSTTGGDPNDVYDTWEFGYNHYHYRKNNDLPYTKQVLQTVRNNSTQGNTISKSDWNIFFETLTHADVDSNNLCPKPNLGPDLTICGQSSLTLNSGITTSGKTFIWSKDNAVISGQSGTSLTATTVGTYKVEVDSANCSLSDQLVISGSLIVNLGTDKELCNPTSYTLDAGNATVPNIEYMWNTGATARTITAITSGTYSVTVSAPNCTAVSDAVVVTSKLLNVTNDTLCTAGTINLSVNGTGSFNWYDVATNGTPLSTSTSYNPNITSNKTFYVENQGGVSFSLGKTVQGTGQIWTVGVTDFTVNDKIYQVSVLKPLTINSVAVYVVNAGTDVTINLEQGGTTAYTKTVTGLGTGKQTIALNFNVTPGNYIIDAIGTTNQLSYEASGATFPYTYPGYISFTYNEAWQSTWYGLFYDWNITAGNVCARTPVYAVIDNNIPNCKSTNIEEISSSENASKSMYSLYPNPIKDRFIIESYNQNKSYEIEIINSIGQVILNKKISNSVEQIDLSGQTAGIYFVKLQTNGNTVVKKIIKQN